MAVCCVDTGAARRLMVGMNFTNAERLSTAQQDATIAQLKAAGVKVVRFGVSADEQGMDLLRRVYAAGIKIELEVSWVYPKDAPRRPFQPAGARRGPVRRRVRHPSVSMARNGAAAQDRAGEQRCGCVRDGRTGRGQAL